MLSIESEEKLCRLLKKVATGERSVQIQRLILCQDYHFSPHTAFLSLDSLRLNSLIPRSFKDFLPATSDLSQQQFYLLIKQYSSQSNGRLSYSDFQQLVLPHTNCSLRSMTQNRRPFIYPQKLSALQQFALKRLIQKEVELQEDMQQLKEELQQKEDFSIWKAFKSLDVESRGMVDQVDLRGLMKKFGEYLSVEDVDAILRRIDTGDDMAIDYNEFVEFMIPVYSCQQRKAEEKSEEEKKTEQENPEQKSQEKLEQSQVQSPKFANEISSFQTPEKAPAKANKEKVSKKLEFGLNFPVVFNLIKTQLQYQRSLQFMRRNLSIHTNFSIDQAMDFFDKEKQGKIFISHFEQALQELKVDFTREIMWLIFPRWGKQDEQTFCFQINEIASLLLPKDQQYTTKLEKRPNSPFNQQTKQQLAILLKTLINYEKTSEELRKQIVKDPSFDLQEAFTVLDQDSDGIIGHNDLQNALKKMGVEAALLDLDLLHLRYSEKEITIKEFAEEVQPKNN